MRVIKQVLAKEVQLGGREHSGWLPQSASEPLLTPTSSVLLNVRILEDVDGFILEYESHDSSFENDTWHPTIEHAEESAKSTFGIESWEWKSSELS